MTVDRLTKDKRRDRQPAREVWPPELDKTDKILHPILEVREKNDKAQSTGERAPDTQAHPVMLNAQPGWYRR